MKKENPLASIGFNIIIPSIIMSKADDWLGLSPALALIIALIFPIGYGVRDFWINKKFNIFSAIGFSSILLTGTIGLLHLPKEYIAIKEAAVPLVLGSIVFISAYTQHPLVETLIFNDSLLKMDLIHKRIEENCFQQEFSKLLSRSTIQFAGSFLLSAILNYILAKYFVHSDTGTVGFNKELGRMTFWSYPVIVLPCTIILMCIMIRLMKAIEKMTELKFEDFLRDSK